MAQQYPDWIWQNGEIKPWKDATAHVMSHALHYGSSVFEGIRSYATPDGAAIFRLTNGAGRNRQNAVDAVRFGQTAEFGQHLERRMHDLRRERPAIEPTGSETDHFLLTIDDFK